MFFEKKQQPENVYDKESIQGSTTSQSDDESDDREEYQDYEYLSDYDEYLEEEIPTDTVGILISILLMSFNVHLILSFILT